MMAIFQAARPHERLEPEFISENSLDLQIKPHVVGLNDLPGHMPKKYDFSGHQNLFLITTKIDKFIASGA